MGTLDDVEPLKLHQNESHDQGAAGHMTLGKVFLTWPGERRETQPHNSDTFWPETETAQT